jgi:hypothetical protein
MRFYAFPVALGAMCIAACSSSTTGGTNTTGSATLSVINATAGSASTQARLDQSPLALPSAGQSSRISISAGTHQLALSSTSGRSFGTLSFSVDPDSNRTVVISGTPDTAVVSVAADSTTPTAAGGPQPLTGQILLVNSAPGVGPFDVYVYRANSDSTLHFGSFSFGAGTAQSTSPYRYLFPFNPGTYTFVVTNPGSTTALVSTTLTLATQDEWVVMLTKAGNGTLALQATRQ